MSETEVIGPIQMGLNKPIHFTDIESSVRDIVNITAIACIDAIVDKKRNNVKPFIKGKAEIGKMTN